MASRNSEIVAAPAGWRAESAPVSRRLIDALRELRHKPDLLLHARRRRATLDRLARSSPQNVVFICHGNICRSPFAAGLFANRLSAETASSVTIISAGFVGPGRPCPPAAQEAALRRGVNLKEHRSAPASAALLGRADLVVVVSARQARTVSEYVRPETHVLVLGDLDPHPISRRTIVDPWNGDQAVFEDSYARIERCVGTLVQAIDRAAASAPATD